MTDVLSSDSISDARSYILNQWQGLTAHLAEGNVPIDNNQCEQLMKQVALGRKNWLHLGSLASGYRTATLMTIVSIAVRNDLDVGSYVEDLLNQLLSGKRDYESLRPDTWAESHPESIRAYRQQQREEHNTRRERERRCRLDRLEKQSIVGMVTSGAYVPSAHSLPLVEETTSRNFRLDSGKSLPKSMQPNARRRIASFSRSECNYTRRRYSHGT